MSDDADEDPSGIILLKQDASFVNQKQITFLVTGVTERSDSRRKLTPGSFFYGEM
jgi:hypothetical protein